MDWIKLIAGETWAILLEMSPYLLLGFLLAGLLSVIIRQDQIEAWLGKKSIASVIKASLLGVPLPLCSCGVIPVTTSLYQKGASKGATTSFLTSTPQTGVDSILATAGLIGPLFAGIRVVVALISGIMTGLIVDLFEKEKARTQVDGTAKEKEKSRPPAEKLKEIVRYGFYTLPQDIGKTLILGIVLAGLLGALLPENWGSSFLGNPFLTYLAVTLIAIPLYVCSTGSIPIAFALMASGISPGAALVFLIAGPATNVATVTTLFKILGRRTIFIYLICIIVFSWISGWLVDLFGGRLISQETIHHHVTGGQSLIQIISGITLLAVILWTYIAPTFFKPTLTMNIEECPTTKIRIEGMTCSHCARHVVQALEAVPGVTEARADATQNLAWIEGSNLSMDALNEAVSKAGYEFKGHA